MANVSVTQANFRKGIFKNLRTALLNVHVDIGTNVYGSYPIKNISLPLLVIENAQKLDTEKSVTGNLTYPGTAFVSIYTKQAEKIDTYADAIEAALWAYESTFKTYNLFLKDIVDNDAVNYQDINGNKGHSKTISVMFEIL